MFAANTYDIHLATEEDDASLSCLADLDSGRPLQRPVLIGQIGGEPAAALSLADGRIVADPHRRTDHLLACLRVRADALRAYEATPSLRARMLAALPARDHHSATGADERTPRRGPQLCSKSYGARRLEVGRQGTVSREGLSSETRTGIR
jgi:hypothetical protein